MVHNEPLLGPANGRSSPLAEDFEIAIDSESGLYYILVQTTLSFGIALANRTTSSAGEDKKALAPSNERSEPLTRFFSERKFQLKVGCPLTGCRASDASEENFSAS